MSITQGLQGQIYGDKGYISKDIFAALYSNGPRLFTGNRKDMKNHLLELDDKTNLRKCSLIESLFNILKNNMDLEHSRHRSLINFLVHMLACITGYAIQKSANTITILTNAYAALS